MLSFKEAPEEVERRVKRTRKVIFCGAIMVFFYNVFYTSFFTVFDIMHKSDNLVWLSEILVFSSLTISVTLRIFQFLLMTYLSRIGINLIDILGE